MMNKQKQLTNHGVLLRVAGSGGKTHHTRKRKNSENDAHGVTATTKPRQNNSGYSNKEDLENKQGRKRNSYTRGAKKKVLEEANNSKLRQVRVRVEDCLQNEEVLSTLCRRAEVVESEAVTVTERSDSGSVVKSGSSGSRKKNKVVKKVAKEEPVVEEIEVPKEEAAETIITVVATETLLASPSETSSSVIEVTPPPQTEDSNNSNSSSVQLLEDEEEEVILSAVSKEEESVVVSEEDDCVIVAEELAVPPSGLGGTGGPGSGCGGSGSVLGVVDGVGAEEEVRARGVLLRECDDEGPLSAASPFSRMELSDSSGATLLRFADDRSDSGVSSLRSGSCASGDERSGSRSSALSSSDEPQQLQQQTQLQVQHTQLSQIPLLQQQTRDVSIYLRSRCNVFGALFNSLNY